MRGKPYVSPKTGGVTKGSWVLGTLVVVAFSLVFFGTSAVAMVKFERRATRPKTTTRQRFSVPSHQGPREYGHHYEDLNPL